MTAAPPSYGPASIERLRNAAMRLAAELDEAREYQASAYVPMAADVIGPRDEAAVNDNRPCNDVECEFELDEHGWVWIILEGDCHIGRREAVRREMWRFLRVLVPGLE